MPPILQIAGLSKRFGAVVVADAISLDVPAGQALGIIGPNGAGKTTLFAMIAGAVAPDAGRVVFDGADITALPPERRCRLGVARSFQIPRPFGGLSVFENLMVAAEFGRAEKSANPARDCVDILDQCGLADLANRRAGALTLLQRKRLELARALASKPKLLLLDEVAGGLTEDECVALVALVKSIHATGVAIVWIEHIVHALLSAVERLVALHAGSIIADGIPRDVIADARVAEIYMGIPADA